MSAFGRKYLRSIRLQGQGSFRKRYNKGIPAPALQVAAGVPAGQISKLTKGNLSQPICVRQIPATSSVLWPAGTPAPTRACGIPLTFDPLRVDPYLQPGGQHLSPEFLRFDATDLVGKLRHRG